MAETPRLNRLEAALRGASAALAGRSWALVGGLAVSAWCEPRFTRDVDLVVAVLDDADSEALVHSLLVGGYRVLGTLEQEARQRLATARLVGPSEPEGGIVVDLLFASSGIEREIADGALPLEMVPGFTVPVARIGHLIALKLLSRDDRRPQDAADLRALLATADGEELARAREAVHLIAERGFGRDRDLPTQFEGLLSGRTGAP